MRYNGSFVDLFISFTFPGVPVWVCFSFAVFGLMDGSLLVAMILTKNGVQ